MMKLEASRDVVEYTTVLNVADVIDRRLVIPTGWNQKITIERGRHGASKSPLFNKNRALQILHAANQHDKIHLVKLVHGIERRGQPRGSKKFKVTVTTGWPSVKGRSGSPANDKTRD